MKNSSQEAPRGTSAAACARSRRGPLSQAGSEHGAFYRGTEGDMLRSIRVFGTHAAGRNAAVSARCCGSALAMALHAQWR
jgi:hypothetical protein